MVLLTLQLHKLKLNIQIWKYFIYIYIYTKMCYIIGIVLHLLLLNHFFPDEPGNIRVI